MNQKFKEGDKIRVKEDTEWGRVEGLTGFIHKADGRTPFYNVTLDEIPDDLEQAGRFHWFMTEDEIELVED